MTKSNLFRLLRGYLWMLLGCIIYALSFAWCYAPSGIAFGGITGVAQIIHHFIPAAPVGVSVIVLNVPLFLLGWKLLGGGTLISSLYAMFLSSVFTDLFCLYDWPPMDEPLMACIFGGVLMGLSLGIVFLQGATTGGTDLIARLLKLKLRWLPMGKLLMAVDLAVILMVAAAFRTLNTALYGIVAHGGGDRTAAGAGGHLHLRGGQLHRPEQAGPDVRLQAAADRSAESPGPSDGPGCLPDRLRRPRGSGPGL